MPKILQRTLQATVLAGLCATALRAQTHFQPADTTPDLSRYRTVEECIAATSRVIETARLSLTVWRDTLPFKSESLDSLPASAISTARQCSAQFNPETVSLNAYEDWMRLFLLANRDDAAKVLMRRRIDSARQKGQNQDSLIRVLFTSMYTYIGARPARWNEILSIGLMFEGSDVKLSEKQRLEVYARQFFTAQDVNDTVTRRRMAEKLVAVANTLSAEQKAESWYQGDGRYGVITALDFLDHLALMDSLRHSSTAYVALKRVNWEKANGSTSDPLPAFLGKQAAPLVADFWFASDRAPSTSGETLNRPTRGKVSLVVFLREGCRAEKPIFIEPFARPTFRGDCWYIYANMHRFAQRFPNLEMTLVSQTSGYLGESSPVTPQAEAGILQKWWLGFHRLPAALAVANTKFFRLQPPDRRRIDESVENTVNYLFGEGLEMPSQQVYLVDTDGIILYSGSMTQYNERELREILDVVMRR